LQEINHAGTGGLWAELVQNRGGSLQFFCFFLIIDFQQQLYCYQGARHCNFSLVLWTDMRMFCVMCWKFVTSSNHSHGGRILGFEAGGLNTPSDIRPWVAVGTETQVLLGTDRSSPFVKNPVALRVAILCDAEDSSSSNQCPHRGVGVSNPGFWGMVSRSLNHLPFYLSVILCCLSHTYKVSEFLIFFFCLFVFCRTFVKEQHIKSSFGCAQLLHWVCLFHSHLQTDHKLLHRRLWSQSLLLTLKLQIA